MGKSKFSVIKMVVWVIYINQQKVNYLAEKEVEFKDLVYMIQKPVSNS